MSKIAKKLCNFKKKNSKVFFNGFTLIELLIAISLFMIGIMGAFSLSLNNLKQSKENVNRVIAADLAREGIEIVRNIRDSNWLAREANEDSDDITLGTQIYEWDHGLSTTQPFIFNFTASYNSDLAPLGARRGTLDTAIGLPEAVLKLDNGFYQHTAGQSTIFSRAIRLQAICLDTSNPVSPVESVANGSLNCTSPNIKIGFQITSRVRYTYGSRTNTIDAVENIYNWRQ